jgi:hypothetical protein
MSFVLNAPASLAALRENVLPRARKQLNDEGVLWKLVYRSNMKVNGERANVTAHFTRNSGVGGRAEGDNSPNAGRQGYQKIQVPLRTQVGRIQITEQAIAAFRGNSTVIGTPFESESKGVITDLTRDMNRQAFGAANGVIALAGVTSASTTVVLAATTPLSAMRQLEVNMVIDIGTVANPTSVASARTITAVNLAGRTITISGAAVTTAATDRIFRQGAGGAIGGVGQRELTGLQAISPPGAGTTLTAAAAGTLFGINPVTEQPGWTPGHLGVASATAGSNRTPTEAVLQSVMDETAISSGTEIDVMISSYGVYRNYGATLTSLKRFNDTVELSGGVKGLDITSGNKTATLTRDRDCPDDAAFGLSLEHIEVLEWGDGMTFMDGDGAVLSRVPNQLAYEASLMWMGDIYVDQRNAHFTIDRLTNG